MPAGPHFVTQTNTIKKTFSIFDINHQNTRRSDQSWNDKHNANYAPSYHMEGFTNGQVAIFKEIFDQVRKDLDCELSTWTKTSQRLTLYLLSSHR